MNTPVLEVTNLSKNFGGLRALNEVDLTINRQEIVALIGPNGAGKTTFFNCITGIYLPTEGTVQLHLPERNGKPASSTTLNGMKPNEITSLGMARTFQNIRLFPTMTVLENVMIGRHCRTSAGIAGAVFQDSRTKAEEQATIDRSYELLREVGLNMHYQDEARNLPYGAQRRLEIARALATDPAVLLAIGGLLLIIVLNALNVKGAILISIIATTLIGIPLGVTTLNGVAAMPDFGELGNVMFNLDFKGVFTASGLILVFVCFFGDFFSTLGTVLAVANRANMLDENGNLPGIERPFLVDAIGTCVGALTGNTTITTFVESTSGVEAGGRTGLTALVAGIMFLLTVFLAPLFVAIPYAATGPALIYVGFLMLKGFTEIDFTDFDEAIGPCVMMMFTAFTGNITNGLGAGIIVHVLVKLVRGKAKEIHPIMYLLCALMVLYFIVG